MLEFLGRGSAFSDEINSCAVMRRDRTLILVDCGENTFSRIKGVIERHAEFGCNIERLNIIITHMHSDHVGGLSTLIYYAQFVRKMEINIYAANTIIDSIKALLDIYKNPSSTYNLMPVKPKKSHYTDGTNVTFTLIPTKHKDDMDCYGIMFGDYESGKNAYYSGDSSTVPAEPGGDDIVFWDKFYQDVSIHETDGVHMYYKDLPKNFPISFLKSDQFEVYHCEDIAMVYKFIKNLEG